MNSFIYGYLGAFLLTLIITPLIVKFARKLGVMDHPGIERKLHFKPTPLLGGLAIYISFVIITALFGFFTPDLIKGYFHWNHLLGIYVAGFVLMTGGFLDDKLNLSANKQIIFPTVAALIAVVSGITIKALTIPTGGTFHFDESILFSAIITFLWLLGMMYTTKYLDGLDGLVSGVGLIASIIVFFVAQHETLQQDYIALLSIIVAGILCGFLIYNFFPASIFLGEGGSLFIGFLIGVLSIVSGTKIATTLLIFGIPILDVVWVILRRYFTGQKIYSADKKHLHHRLLAIGLTHKGAVLFIYSVTALFGLTAVFVQTLYKIYALGILVVFMVGLGMYLVILSRKRGMSLDSKH